MDNKLLCIVVVDGYVRVQILTDDVWTTHISVPYEEGEHEFNIDGQTCKLSIYYSGIFLKVSLLDYTPLGI